MASGETKGFLGWVERTGNRLPDPVFIFFWLIGFLIVGSAIAAAVGYSALHPTQLDESGQPVVITATSMLSADNIRRLWVEMPKTFTHFHPLGYVLVVMLGAGVAERSGLFAAAMRRGVRGAPTFLLTPAVAFVAMMGNLAADAAYVVLIPLAGVLFAAAGRHPIAGITAAFAGVSGGFSANLLPGQLDALLFGITQAAAEQIAPEWTANIAGNWFFIAAFLVILLPVIWFVTDVLVEPRLRRVAPADATALPTSVRPTPPSPRRSARVCSGPVWPRCWCAACGSCSCSCRTRRSSTRRRRRGRRGSRPSTSRWWQASSCSSWVRGGRTAQRRAP
jgi:aminobenzoyl-glutamate transport protein